MHPWRETLQSSPVLSEETNDHERGGFQVVDVGRDSPKHSPGTIERILSECCALLALDRCAEAVVSQSFRRRAPHSAQRASFLPNHITIGRPFFPGKRCFLFRVRRCAVFTRRSQTLSGCCAVCSLAYPSTEPKTKQAGWFVPAGGVAPQGFHDTAGRPPCPGRRLRRRAAERGGWFGSTRGAALRAL